jgi:hypothetical protein
LGKDVKTEKEQTGWKEMKRGIIEGCGLSLVSPSYK